ncbi:MAG: LysR family transcriptional regulator [Sphingomonadaceae bacterium]|nr:LysR family transcriptional regulator [Sphingomonadaceae bacterium]
MKRTHLPLNALRVFDAAARHLNFTRAADELAVTPAAVGQQVRALEDVLGVVLFRRTPKGLELTAEAEAGLDALRSGFLKFEESVTLMRAGQSSKSLTIAAPRDLTQRWLMPRLAGLSAADPELQFRLIAADNILDFTEANLDLALRWANDPGDLEGAALDDGTMVHIAPLAGDGDLHIIWTGEGAGNADDRAILHVADAGLALDAVITGLGQAKIPEILAASDIAAGRVRVIDRAVGAQASCWLLAPTPQWRQKKVRALVATLMEG